MCVYKFIHSSFFIYVYIFAFADDLTGCDSKPCMQGACSALRGGAYYCSCIPGMLSIRRMTN